MSSLKKAIFIKKDANADRADSFYYTYIVKFANDVVFY